MRHKQEGKMNNTQNIVNIELTQTPLMNAAKLGDIENLNVILQSTDIFNWSKKNEEGQTALIIAILNNQKESVKTICNACEKLEDAKLTKSQLIDFKFSDEEDLLHYAIHRINNVIFQLKMKEALTPTCAPIMGASESLAIS